MIRPVDLVGLVGVCPKAFAGNIVSMFDLVRNEVIPIGIQLGRNGSLESMSIVLKDDLRTETQKKNAQSGSGLGRGGGRKRDGSTGGKKSNASVTEGKVTVSVVESPTGDHGVQFRSLKQSKTDVAIINIFFPSIIVSDLEKSFFISF